MELDWQVKEPVTSLKRFLTNQGISHRAVSYTHLTLPTN